MAANLECELTEGQATIPGNPNPWQVNLKFFDTEHSLVRTWAVDAPSELVGKTLKAAIDNLTDESYDTLYGQGYVH